MFCPKCRVEYREGFDHCSECNVPLVAALPPEDAEEYTDLVTVMQGPDENVVLVVKSLLEANGIQCFANGEGLQDFVGFGRMGTGFNPMVGPVEIQVLPEDADRAREILATQGDLDLPEE